MKSLNIELDDDELGCLQETLAGYPLNLSIACEEIIAERNVNPEQMLRLITNLIHGAPAKKTAELAGEILGRPITVPKNFEKSTVEELETKNSTAAYIIARNKIPLLRFVMIIAILAVSVFIFT